MSDTKPTLLVTGASGQLGRLVVTLLLEQNAGTIIAATRTPEKLADLAAQGVTVRHADFDDPASLTAAFAGVDRLLLISTDRLDVPGLRIQQHLNAVNAAEEAGVSHVVYTSIVNPTPAFPAFVNTDHRTTEEGLENSKVGFTILRENIYTDYLIGSLGRVLASGQLRNASADGKTAYITREDCARASAAALASTFVGRRTIDITGPEALSQADVAHIVSTVTGQTITYTPVELEGVIQGMVGAGLPRPVAEAFASFDVATAVGQFAQVSSGVEDLTGRKPIGLADFLRAHQDTLVS